MKSRFEILKKILKKNIFIRTFIILSVFTLIPLILVNVTFLNQSKSTIKNLAIDSSLNLVDKTSKAVDLVVIGVNQTIKQLSKSDAILNYIIDPDISNYNRNNSIINELNSIVASNDLIHSIYVYSNHEKTIISSSRGVFNKDEFYDIEWIEEYNDNFLGVKQLGKRTITDSMGNEFNYITYICNLPYLSLSKVGAVVINVNEDKIYEIIKSIDNTNQEKGNVFILDKEGNIIVGDNYINNINFSNLANIDFSEKRGYSIHSINEEEIMISFKSSEYNGWKYIYTIPTKFLFRDSNRISNIIFIITFLLAIGLITFYFLISKGVYKPLKALINTIPDSAIKNIDHNESSYLDEYELLGHIYNNVIHKNKTLEEILETTKPALKERFIINLIRGAFNQYDEIYERVKYLGISFNSDNFIVMVMQIDNYEQFDSKFNDKERYIFRMDIVSLIENTLSDEFSSYCAELKVDKLVCIINSIDKIQKDYLLNKIEKVKDLIKEKYPFSMTFALGREYENIQDIKRSYKEAQKALKYKLYQGNNQIIDYNNIEKITEEPYFYKNHNEKILINSIKAGQSNETQKILENIFNDIMENPKTTRMYIHQFFMRLLDSILNIINEMNISLEKIFGDDINLYKELTEKETISDIHKWMSGICDLVIDEINKMEISKSDYNKEKIIEYIEANYNKDISLNDVACNSNLSSGYVCKIFKEGIGKSYTQYISELRVEKAKELLKETKLTVKDIAFSSGFNNIQTFNRTFKKYVGVSPGQYRLKAL